MDPITSILGIAGIGMSLFGSIEGAATAKKSAAISSNIANLQTQENQQRQLAMQITGRRNQMQTIRTAQQTAAQAKAAGVNQGAQFGSGVAGGQSQIASQSSSNLTGENQQLQVGNAIFGLDAQIGVDKMNLSSLQGQQATYSGISSMGSTLARSSGTASNIFGNLFPGNTNTPGNPITNIMNSSGFSVGGA
jgi:hypothetical protein